MEVIRKNVEEHWRRVNSDFVAEVTRHIEETLKDDPCATSFSYPLIQLTGEPSQNLAQAVQELSAKDIVVTFDADHFFQCFLWKKVHVSWAPLPENE
jgi:hypothetical protein